MSQHQVVWHNREYAEQQLETLFNQTLDGCFFCMFAQPLCWNETADKESVLQQAFTEMRITKVNDAILAQYGAVPSQLLGMSLHNRFQHDPEQGRNLLRQLLDAGRLHIETDERRLDGRQVWFEANYSCLYNEAGWITGHFGIQRDITARKRTETELRIREQRFCSLLKNATDIIVILNAEGQFTYASPSAERILGYEPVDVVGKSAFEFVHPEDQVAVLQVLQQALQQPGVSQPLVEYRVRHGEGHWVMFEAITTNLLQDPAVQGVVVNCHDITARKQAERALQIEAEREQILGKIAQRIRQSLQLPEILETTVYEVQQLLQSDQVLIAQMGADGQGQVVAKATVAEQPIVLGPSWGLQVSEQGTRVNPYFVPVNPVEDADVTTLPSCLRSGSVQSQLVIPILQAADHASIHSQWGWLVVHQMQMPRLWQQWEVTLLQRLATQLAIAIEHAELHQRLQQLNTTLEQQVSKRTAQLQKALDLEARLKRITDAVRDSLDEHQILQTAVQELALGLGLLCCDSGIYSSDQTVSTICYEYFPDADLALMNSAKHQVCSLQNAHSLEVYRHLLQGQSCQFCFTVTDPVRPTQGPKTVLACPVFDNQGVLGDLWLFKPSEEIFTAFEMRLVQQVANQCAIAIRQARLYQAAQTQVEQLERLNHMKDDFLSTVSHELRTPISNIKMASQMLKVVCDRADLPESDRSAIERYLRVLREECDREIHLINDLLDLQSPEPEKTGASSNTINLNTWLPQLLEPYRQRAQHHHQRFQVHISDPLPSLDCDASKLERIITELLENACKYTPAHENIVILVRVLASPEQLEVIVQNSGAEIEAAELPHIFDKFYRIPHADRWRHSGTGLGLALVKKLVERLKGTVGVVSECPWTTFTVRIPLDTDIS